MATGHRLPTRMRAVETETTRWALNLAPFDQRPPHIDLSKVASFESFVVWAGLTRVGPLVCSDALSPGSFLRRRPGDAAAVRLTSSRSELIL